MVLTQIKPQDYDVFVGIDADKKSFAVTYKIDTDTQYRSLKMPANPDTLTRYFQKRFPQQRLLFAYEAGPTGWHLYDRITETSQSCILIHPGNVPKAPKDRVKTNRLDSVKITQQLQGGQLPGIYVPSEDYRQLRHLASLRQQYARDLRRAKQRIQSLLLFEHIDEPELEVCRWTARHIELLKQLQIEPIRQFKLQSLISDLEYSRDRLLQVHKQLKTFCKEHDCVGKQVELLRSIPGFGFIVPIYFLARIGDPAELRPITHLGSFMGVVPSERSSGDKVRRGSITHMGDRDLRFLLIEAAWIAIRKDKELNEFYHRIKTKRRGEAAARIAIVAVARKLTHRAHRVLKDQRPYQVR